MPQSYGKIKEGDSAIIENIPILFELISINLFYALYFITSNAKQQTIYISD